MVVSILPVIGCSSTTTVSRSEWSGVAKDVVRGNAGQDAAIEFTEPVRAQAAGTIGNGKLGAVDLNGFVLYERSGRAYRIPFDQAHSISLTDRKMGAANGLWIGAIPGAVGGATLGLAASGLCGGLSWTAEQQSQCDSVAPLAEGVILGAAVGAMVGAVIGLLTGRRTTFRSEDQRDFLRPKVPSRLSESPRCRCEGDVEP
jgi:hypothetical protein